MPDTDLLIPRQVYPSSGWRRISGAIMAFAKVQGSQPSTWRGVVWLLSSLGIAFSPDLSAAIIAAGAAVSGLIGMLAGPDAPPPPAD